MQDHAAVLTAINDFRRTQFGLEPLEAIPPGIRTSPTCCPLAQCLPVDEVSSRGAYLWPSDDGPDYIEFPSTLIWFVQAFDDGEFPELEEK